MSVGKSNEKIATAIANATGNMWFFWVALAFVLALRISHPPKMSDLLLNLENDLQLLLLAVNAVVGGKQLTMLMSILCRLETDERNIKDELDEVDRIVVRSPGHLVIHTPHRVIPPAARRRCNLDPRSGTAGARHRRHLPHRRHRGT